MAVRWFDKQRGQLPGIHGVGGAYGGKIFRRFTAPASRNDEGSLEIYLMEGTTEIFSTEALTQPNWENITLALSTTEIAAVSDWTNLSIKLNANNEQCRVSYARVVADFPTQSDLTVALLQGTTEIASVQATLTNDYVTIESELTSDEAANLSVSTNSLLENLSLSITANSEDASSIRIAQSYVDATQTAADTTALTITLLEGTTQIASIQPTLSDTFGTYSYSLTSAEQASISDFTALSLEVKANGTSAAAVSQLYVDGSYTTPPVTGGWNGVVYHPGGYIYFDPNMDLSDTTELASRYAFWRNEDSVDGVGFVLHWNDIETAKNTYDWSVIDRVLDYIAGTNAADGTNKKVMLDIKNRTHVAGAFYMPSWLASTYGGQSYTWTLTQLGGNGKAPIVWPNANGSGAYQYVIEAIEKFWQAFVNRYESRSDELALVPSGETSWSSANVGDGYTNQRLEDYLDSHMVFLRGLSSTMPWMLRMNSLGGEAESFTRLSRLAARCIEQNIYLGGPDALIGGWQERTSYAVQRNVFGAIPCGVDNQWQSYTFRSPYLGRTQTMNDVVNYFSGGQAGSYTGPRFQFLTFYDFRGTVNGEDTRAAARDALTAYRNQFPVVI